METLSQKLKSVYENVYVFKMPKKKPDYSKPKIYTGSIDISKWSKLSKEDKKTALSKRWYIYYSFRNPSTGKLKLQTPLTLSVNRFKTKEERYRILKVYRDVLEQLLETGEVNPYEKNINEELSNKNLNISKACEIFLKEKEKSISIRTHKDLERRLSKFTSFLNKKQPSIDILVSTITKTMVINYLNTILETSSPRTRNNVRVDLSTFFNWLSNNDYIPKNIVESIPILKTKVQTHKVYTNSQSMDVFDYMKEKDPILLLFVKFVSYGFLRPLEVCRLTVGDIDQKNKTISFKAKNKTLKTKIIPHILWDEIPKEWLEYPKEYNLFGTTNEPMIWDTEENNKRNFYSKKFKKIKEALNLDENHTMYSFRHTFITKLYINFREKFSPFQAKSELMLITGHHSMDALEKYLREIDAELAEDYSSMLE